MKVQNYWVGSLHFSENFGDDTLEPLNALPPIEALDGKLYKIRAEHLIIDEVSIDHQPKYRLIIDRRSYLYPQATGLFMGYAFQGVYLINNPFSFYYYLNNKDAAYMVARELGIKIPKTYILPPKEAPDLTNADFKYHRYLDWEAMTEDLGWPVVIKPVAGREGIGLNVAHNLRELWHSYDHSGSQFMLLQRQVITPHYWQIRVLCIGKKLFLSNTYFAKEMPAIICFIQSLSTQKWDSE